MAGLGRDGRCRVTAPRVYISADIEGVTGVMHQEQSSPASPQRGEYEWARRAMTADVNAAVAGAFDGGASAVTVNDSHATMRNILPDQLDRRAVLVRGAIKPACMMQELDAATDLVFLVGYHARAGVGDGVLSHTLDGGQVRRLLVNGGEVGELTLSAWMAGARGIPVGLVTGDDATCREATALLGDGVRTVATKRGLDRTTAVCRAPADVLAEIAAAAREATGAPRRARPVEPPAMLDVTIEWRSTTAAAVAAWVPGVERCAGDATVFSTADVHEAVALVQVLLLAANAATGAL